LDSSHARRRRRDLLLANGAALAVVVAALLLRWWEAAAFGLGVLLILDILVLVRERALRARGEEHDDEVEP
jgi:type IV secretory pathway TrbD component